MLPLNTITILMLTQLCSVFGNDFKVGNWFVDEIIADIPKLGRINHFQAITISPSMVILKWSWNQFKYPARQKFYVAEPEINCRAGSAPKSYLSCDVKVTPCRPAANHNVVRRTYPVGDNHRSLIVYPGTETSCTRTCTRSYQGLTPDTHYLFRLLSRDNRTCLSVAVNSTFMESGVLSPVNVSSPTKAVFRWISHDIPSKQRPLRVTFIYRQFADNNYGYKRREFIIWDMPYDSATTEISSREFIPEDYHTNDTKASASYLIQLKNLQPNRNYAYGLLVTYSVHGHYFNLTGSALHEYRHSQGIFRTPPTFPTAPMTLRPDLSGDQLQFVWNRPKHDGGQPVTSYVLWYASNNDSNWQQVETNDTFWTPPEQLLCPGCRIMVKVAARNGVGLSPACDVVDYGLPSLVTPSTIGLIVVGCTLPLVIAALMFLACYHRRKRRKLQETLELAANDTAPIILPKDLEQLPRVTLDDINITKELGEGNFGKVYEGFVCNLGITAHQDETKAIRAAFKTLQQNATIEQRNELISEALTMRNLIHPNIVRLLGLCVNVNELWLILEMMDGGDLLSHLRSVRPGPRIASQVSTRDLIRMAIAVVRGCEYLQSLGYVHRDLAARNCLVSNRNPTSCDVKIADFGLTRGVYQKFYYRLTESSVFPIRWTAPEVLRDHIFDAGCDVWSFGILLWEILTLGEHPYSDKSDLEVVKFVRGGNTLQQPEPCPDELYATMQRCWGPFPEERPRFSTLAAELDEEMNSGRNSSQRPYMGATQKSQRWPLPSTAAKPSPEGVEAAGAALSRDDNDRTMITSPGPDASTPNPDSDDQWSCATNRGKDGPSPYSPFSQTLPLLPVTIMTEQRTKAASMVQEDAVAAPWACPTGQPSRCAPLPDLVSGLTFDQRNPTKTSGQAAGLPVNTFAENSRTHQQCSSSETDHIETCLVSSPHISTTLLPTNILQKSSTYQAVENALYFEDGLEESPLVLRKSFQVAQPRCF